MQGSLAATLAVIAGFTAGGDAAAPFAIADGPVASDRCGIYLEEGPSGLYLAAYAAEGEAGEYIFSLRQAGSNGASLITQSGEFESLEEGPVLLSEMTLDLDGGFEASLQTYSWSGEFICRVIV